MPIDTAQLAQMLYGDPAHQGEAGTGAPMQNPMDPTAAPDPILAEVAGMAHQPAGNFAPKTVEYDAFGNPVSAPPSLPPGIGKVSEASTQRGYSADKMAQIEAGPMGTAKLDKKKQTAEDGIRNDFADERAGIIGAAEAEAAATTQFSAAESDRIVAESGHMTKMSSMQQKHADAMKALSIDSALAAQQAKDEYRARLTAIPELNPNALWDEAGTSGQFQMATAAVIHNMLGVKGIKTTAMDTINQAIKNKIDAQIYNINTKKEVAAGFKDLYNMTVAESATQMEVEAKLHGYYLKAMETGIKAEMGKYDSAVHRAKAQLALSQVRKDLAKNLFEVEKQIQDNADKAAGRELTARGQSLQYSMASEQRKHEIALQKLKNKEGEMVNPYGNLMFDTSESGETFASREFLPWVKDEKKADISEKAAGISSALSGIRRLAELHRQAGKKPDLLGDTRFMNEMTRAANAASQLQGLMLAYSKSGKTLGPYEVKVYDQMFSSPTWFTNGQNIKKLATVSQSLINEKRQLEENFSVALPKDDPRRQLKTGRSDYAAGENDEVQQIMNPVGKPRDVVLTEKIKSPNSLFGINEDKLTPDRMSEHELFTKKYWADYKKERPEAKAQSPYTANSWDGDMKKIQAKYEAGIPEAFDALRELAEAAFGGNDAAKAKIDDLAVLNTKQNGKNDAEIAKMAQYFKTKLEQAGVVPGTKATRGFGFDEVGDALLDTDASPASTIPVR